MVLVQETRCGAPEVCHIGAVAISTPQAAQIFGHELAYKAPLRSTAKPFFLGALLKVILSGERFSDRELALMSSSHNGESQHIDVLLNLVSRYGITLEQIRCGCHHKFKEWSVPNPPGSNCSGKHAAFLIACKVAGYTIDDYLEPTHKIHSVIKEELAFSFGAPPEAVGVDGCSLPTYLYSIKSIATAFRRFANDELGEDYKKVRDAHLKASFYVGGTDRLESYLIGRYGLAAKSGSDGVWAIGVPKANLGLSVKILGGSEPAAQAVLLDILYQRKLLNLTSDDYLKGYHNKLLYSWAGRPYGEYNVCFRESHPI